MKSSTSRSSSSRLLLWTSLLVIVCFAAALGGLWQWGQDNGMARLDRFSVLALTLSALFVIEHVIFYRRLPQTTTAGEAFGATYDPAMGYWNAGLMLAETSVFFDYGHWHLTPALEQASLQWTGLATYASALLLLLWTDTHLLRHFSANSNALITDGPYRFIKHPRYLSLFLTRIAFALTFASVIEWGLIVVWAVVVRRRIKVEEHYLQATVNCEP